MPDLDLLLVNMPFGELKCPALGVSLLSSAAKSRGFSSKVEYYNLDLAAWIGVDLFRQIQISFSSGSLMGDWMFAEAAFGPDARPAEDFERWLLAEYARLCDTEADLRRWADLTFPVYLETKLLPQLRLVREKLGVFCDMAAEEILAQHPRIVGFSLNSHQTTASLAVARRLKLAEDPPVVVFGGSNCHGEMGYQMLQSFPWIDYVCTGEGDKIFPEFLERFLRQGDAAGLPGLIKQGSGAPLTLPPSVSDMDEVPVPDFTDYFHQLWPQPIASDVEPAYMPMETSRGCWWGAKYQCKFCAFEENLIGFRSKSVDRVLAEMAELTGSWGARMFMFADDIIDTKYFTTLFPELARLGAPYPIFTELKANLTYENIRVLRDAGVIDMQAGLEQLSDAVLKIIPKGVSGHNNLQVLRWSEELGVETYWNCLYGFPEEPIDEYDRLEALVPLITHLRPPQGFIHIALKRFAPYFQDWAGHGLRDVRPSGAYHHVYPLPPQHLADLAFYFDFAYADGRDPLEYTASFRKTYGKWFDLWAHPEVPHPRLDARWDGDVMRISDTRPGAVRPVHVLSLDEAQILEYCDRARTRVHVAGEFDASLRAERIDEILAKLIADRLLLESGGRFLALAVFRTRRAASRSRAPVTVESAGRRPA